MHFCIFNHRLSHQLEGLHYLVLRLPARTFSGLVREAASTTVSLYPPSGAAWFWPLLFSSTRFISTPWIFDFYGFQPCPIWKVTWGIRSVLEVTFLLQCLQCFWMGFQSGQRIFSIASGARWRLCSVRSLPGSPLLPPDHWMSYRSSGSTSFWGILILPKFSMIIGVFQSSLNDYSAITSDVPGILIPIFCCSLIETKKVSPGWLPSIQLYF